LGLTDDRRLFFKIRRSCEIIVKKHAYKDYPDRGFSEREIIDLVRNGTGRMEDNPSSEAINGSYLFIPNDDINRKCKLVILINLTEFEGEDSTEEVKVIVCSAYREIT